MKLNKSFLTAAAFILCIAALNTTKAQTDTLVRMKSNATEIEIYLQLTPSTAVVKANGVTISHGINIILVNNDSTVFITTEDNVQLTVLYCSSNQLTELDVTNSTALQSLECHNNQLTELDVSNNTTLLYLSCVSNQLTELDITNNTALVYLSCSYNQLTELDVSNNTALEMLSCVSNQLTELDITNNTALTVLYCSFNQLTELDVTNNTALQSLECHNNQLTELDVSNNMVQWLNAQAQQIEIPILSGATTFSNPVLYKIPAGEDSVEIEGVWYTYQDEVPITKDTMSFTTNLPAGVTYEYPFGGTMSFVFMPSFTVNYESNGGSTVASQVVLPNSKVTVPTAPTKAEHTFGGWYGDADLSITWNFATSLVTQDTTLYAKWTPATQPPSIAETETNTINLYPNPAQNTLYIESAETVEQVIIYDISGRTLQQTNNPSTSIDVSNLANGIYLVKVKTAQGETVRKISRLAN